MVAMSAVYIALPVALLLAAAALAGFVWAARSGQLDDLETPGTRLLIDDDDVTRRKPADDRENASGD